MPAPLRYPLSLYPGAGVAGAVGRVGRWLRPPSQIRRDPFGVLSRPYHLYSGLLWQSLAIEGRCKVVAAAKQLERARWQEPAGRAASAGLTEGVATGSPQAVQLRSGAGLSAGAPLRL